ncbi:lipopolysaccharide assembly protein LapB [Alcaligenes ammonioxydans]|uniref:Lipopolysaccharide assembly protein B n=1 Tax=Alcaligenes ammonioxydans TaxID=2582914 RepID=A0ABX8SU29_9BURK|nr:lipopolysaccharide assembly protein LapB [Alcaligenes ammonioxydans]EJC65222.1 tetratricopeptide repeat protein [Alcaligenes faecalis subsp. faecalis NCIB 8687]QBH18377.1 lipopolysaccharide assembly protein LapB [Alcaligenes faecalis]MCH1878072.1 lipopolysaccharide assembly protein LapB [Alcaligenes ammonioxydans]QXX79531.1 lipopolysaccharide assembly protein LapB [Alcaligenes ammonioxydans]WGQ34459.1 lipopolysaccharide assembly protein LapB [Alcaligenes faecalis]
MDFETWWLVFVPLLFGLGWVAARVDFRQMMSETRSLPDSYFKGLNFLLNEEPDRAIDAFVEVAKLDPETTELHFALGSLFRRRGEMERAIRVHQSLLSRADLPVADRENAQFQIAQDFLKAGMLDRAEAAFEAVRETRFAIPAMRALIRIYESEHDWPRAIEAVRRLRALVDEPVPQLVHYQCEQAEGALQGKQPDFDRAAKALDEAENAIRKLGTGQGMYASQARVAGLRARLARMQGQNEQERAYLVSILSSAPEYVGLYATELLDSYRKLGRAEEGVAMLRSHYQQHPSLDIFNVLFRVLREQEGHLQAWAFARDALRAHPSLLGLDKMLEVELQDQGQDKEGGDGGQAVGVDQIIAGADLSLLRSLIHRHTQRLDRYSCSSCGFEARHFYWQCPGCNSWETYAPRRLEELK